MKGLFGDARRRPFETSDGASSSLQIDIPNEALKYVLFQRTEYLLFQRNRFVRRFLVDGPFLSFNRYVSLEAYFLRNRVKRLFSHDMAQEYGRIKDHLPPKAASILDIGSGVAGIDVFLDHHYRTTRPHLYLLDKSEVTEKVYYGLEKSAAFYNSLDVARRLLARNGIARERIHTAEAGDDGQIPFDGPIDLIISILSWGYHYPVSVYLDQVYDLLRPGGTLVVDLRNSSDGEKLLRQKFPAMKVIHETEKYRRMVSRKP